MKRFLLAVCLIMSAVTTSGCAVLQQIGGGAIADTPTKRWAQAREALTSANDLLVTLVHSGAISDQQFVSYGLALQDARTLINAAKDQLPAGGTDFDSQLREAQDLLLKLKTILQQKEAAHGRNTGDYRLDRRRADGDHRFAVGDGAGDPLAGDPAYAGGTVRRATGGHLPACWYQRLAA